MLRLTALLRNWFVLSLVLVGVCAAHAQVALGTGTYTQTFDSLGSGLPLGWSVYTGATATALGTSVSPAGTAATWGGTTGQWENCASATGMVGNESTAVQNAASNRALAIRQSGTFGDPGASANFNFSTLGVQVTSITFSAQMLSVQTRSTIWQLQYGLGASPSSWTTIGTFTDPGVFGSTTITASGFGTVLDNQGNVWLRVVTLAASTGSGSRDTFGIDNFSIVTVSGGGSIPPSVGTQPSSQTVTEGAASVQFHVVANGTAPFTYHWRKGGAPLTNGGNVSGALTDTLTLTSITLGDQGSYDVVISNGTPPDATSNAATLTVNPLLVPPSITTSPSSQSVALGANANFSVVAAGTAPLTYQWRFGGSPLANGAKYTGVDTATLTVHSVTADDAGSYDVVVSNSVPPSATSGAATLSIAPLVTPTNQLAYTGGSYTQNFDTLPSTGTFTLGSAGPLPFTDAPINATGLGGWSLAKYDGTGTVALFRVDAGTGTSGSIYSYGSAGASDRALGSLSSGTTVPRF
ncbi:MAG TPA: immunoglobulin domain-containing protein, partial [Candidatus Didemnitutus sp.]|nr:immunoglobulin domain-containing protein [Candidatus Didemnitutus sp.]